MNLLIDMVDFATFMACVYIHNGIKNTHSLFVWDFGYIIIKIDPLILNTLSLILSTDMSINKVTNYEDEGGGHAPFCICCFLIF